MSTVQIAIEAKQELQAQEWEPAEEWDGINFDNQEGEVQVRALYIGSYMNLDPCGRYHHLLSPNGVTRRCEDFWDSLWRQCEKRGLSLEAGEGDPTDIFICEYRDTPEEEGAGGCAICGEPIEYPDTDTLCLLCQQAQDELYSERNSAATERYAAMEEEGS